MLVINGTKKSSGAPDPIPQIIDPTVEPPTIRGGPPQPLDPFGDDRRGYHNVALLLPDGRVLAGGGRDYMKRGQGHWERPDVGFFYPYPPGPRPQIGVLATDDMAYGQPFDIPYSGGPIARVTLIALGAMTHDIDMNQRYVALGIESQTAGTIRVSGPPTRFVAPPGHYLLFILNDAGIPSVARTVKLS